MREEQGIERASSKPSDDPIRAVERANADMDPDPEGSDASIIEAVKMDPSAGVRASTEQLKAAIEELWADNQRTQARRVMFANSHRFDTNRQNAILGGEELDPDVSPQSGRDRWNERNPQSPDAAERRRRQNAEHEPAVDGPTSTMETAPGSIQDRRAEEQKREEFERRRTRENATDDDGVDMSLAPSSAKDRFEQRQNARYEDDEE